MATATSPPDSEQDYGSDPGQEEYEQLIERNSGVDDFYKRQKTPAGGSSDPRDNDNDEDYGKRQQTAAGDSSDPRGDTSEAEETSQLERHENQVGSGYRQHKTAGKQNQSWFKQNIMGRKKVVGGGIIGATIAGALTFFSIFSGPFQFIHLSHLEQQFHFLPQQNAQNDRFMHEIRWLRYASQGKAERSRMSFLGNKLTDKFEGQLRTAGLMPRYSQAFGVFIGYEIDRTSPDSPFNGMSEDEAKVAVKRDYGIDVANYDGKLGAIETLKTGSLYIKPPSSFLGALTFNFQSLKQSGSNGLAASVGARNMCIRRGCTLHPLSKLEFAGLTKIEEKRAKLKQDREDEIEKGTKPDLGQAAADGSDSDKPGPTDARASAQTSAANANETVQETQASGADVGAEGSKIAVKSAGAGLFAIGIACTLREIDKQAGQIKDAQVVAPLIRMGVQAIAIGEQVESGQDFDSQTLGLYAEQLSGVDSSGNKDSWLFAAPIQTAMGKPGKGVVPPDADTFRGAADSVAPFKELDSGIIGSLLGKVCSGIGGFIFSAIGFVTGGPAGIAAGLAQGFLTQKIADKAAHWIAGKAVDINVVGADYGYTVDYGVRLAANDQNIGAGGRALQPAEEGQLAALVKAEGQSQFNKQSITHKLFDPYDESSAISKVIDQSSPDISDNIARMASATLNLKGAFASLAGLLFRQAHAATSTTFDYGFPAYGFSADELSNSKFENPYENACYVVGCPNKGIIGFMTDASGNINDAGQKYQRKVQQCFGVNIAQNVDSSGNKQWGVTNYKSPNYSDMEKNNCNDPNVTGNAENWQRLRFFILDTETMNAMACYEGDSTDLDVTQACSDSGFGANLSGSTATTPITTGGTPPSSGGTVSGDAQAIAQQILNNKNIDLVTYSPTALQDVQAAAAGKPGTASVMTSAAILKLIASVGQSHRVLITAIQSGGQGHCNDTPKSGCPNDPHYTGDAVDFGNLDGTSLTGRDSGSIKIMQTAFLVLPAGSGFGQSQCGTTPALPSGDITFNDSCNHLHIQVKPGTP
jgi:hypothetical protein